MFNWNQLLLKQLVGIKLKNANRHFLTCSIMNNFSIKKYKLLKIKIQIVLECLNSYS